MDNRMELKLLLILDLNLIYQLLLHIICNVNQTTIIIIAIPTISLILNITQPLNMLIKLLHQIDQKNRSLLKLRYQNQVMAQQDTQLMLRMHLLIKILNQVIMDLIPQPNKLHGN